MELLQDGVVAALAAIGVTALIWLAASLLLWRERPVDAVYLVRVSGDGTGLDVTLRRLAQSRRLPVLLVDCGLTSISLYILFVKHFFHFFSNLPEFCYFP